MNTETTRKLLSVDVGEVEFGGEEEGEGMVEVEVEDSALG